MHKEIKILGAGIAGLTAAINLAQKGFNVTVYEKMPSVGYRFCNDFQGLENWSDEKDSLDMLRGISIKTDFWHKGFNQVSVYTDLKKEHIVKDKKNLFYLVKRGQRNSLDENLKNQALASGAKIQFNSKTSEKECDIIATGHAGKKQVGIVKGIVFDTDAEDSVTLLLNNWLAPNGYSYSLIVDGKATSASVLLKDFSKANICLRRTIQAIKKIKKLKIENKKEFGGYGFFALNRTAIQNKKLVAGEAAGFQDFLWGFGMKYAFLSGYAAAQSIIEEKDYDKLWKELLLGKLKASVSNRFIWELLGNFGYNYFINQAIKSKKTKEWLKKLYSYDLSKKIIFPLAKLTKL